MALVVKALGVSILTQAAGMSLRAWLYHTPSLVIFVLNGGLSLGTIHFNFDLGFRVSTVPGGRNSGVCASCPHALPCCFPPTSHALEKLPQDTLQTLSPQVCCFLLDFHWWLSPKCWSCIWLKDLYLLQCVIPGTPEVWLTELHLQS